MSRRCRPPQGLGDLGPTALAWVDRLHEAGQRWWQALPLGPTGYSDWPYQCLSSFAGNELLISPDGLIDDGLLRAADCAGQAFSPSVVEYEKIVPFKVRLLETAWIRFSAGARPDLRPAYEQFGHATRRGSTTTPCSGAEGPVQRRMLSRLACRAGPTHPGGNRARAARGGQRDRPTGSPSSCSPDRRNARATRRRPGRAADRRSADLCLPRLGRRVGHPELFGLGRPPPNRRGGVPPDYFSEDGQPRATRSTTGTRCGARGFAGGRPLRALLAQVDLIRLDHFRGFEAAWEVPAEARRPRGPLGPRPGRRVLASRREGAGRAALHRRRPRAHQAGSEALRERFGLPGMRVLQFAFGGADKPHLPDKYVPNTMAYTGTHDNDTTRGWSGDSVPERSRVEVASGVPPAPRRGGPGADPAGMEIGGRPGGRPVAGRTRPRHRGPDERAGPRGGELGLARYGGHAVPHAPWSGCAT